MLFYIPFTYAAVPEWMVELRRMGFQGRAVVNQDPEWRNYGLSPLAFVVTALPETLVSSPLWPFMDQRMVEELRVIQAGQPVRLVMAFSVDIGGRLKAAATIKAHRFWSRLDWPTAYQPNNLILTQKAPGYAIPHEKRHLEDYALLMDLKLIQELDQMGWDFDQVDKLGTFITEVRANIAEANHHQQGDEELRAQTFDRVYLKPIKEFLRAHNHTQAIRFTAMVRAYVSDLPDNSVSRRIFASLEEEWPCEDILTRSLR